MAQSNNLATAKSKHHRSDGIAVAHGTVKRERSSANVTVKRLKNKLERCEREIELLRNDIANVHLMFDAVDVPQAERAYERVMGFADGWRRRASTGTHVSIEAQKMMTAIQTKLWLL